ncbi:hypothetical protein [Shewanella sp.]|uniref:hypothetical protein n=1 Tax=Shewanella sp. TaxID=50422 RepID=UPI00356364B1
MTNAADKQLDTLIAKAPRELTPPAGSWDAIATRLDRPQVEYRASKPRWLMPAALSACLLLALLPLLLKQPASEVDNSLLPLIESIEHAHFQEVASLETASSHAWQKAGFQETVDAGLQELREAARLILGSLKANPHDKQLWQLWLWVQRREIELLTQGQRLPAAATQGDTL